MRLGDRRRVDMEPARRSLPDGQKWVFVLAAQSFSISARLPLTNWSRVTLRRRAGCNEARGVEGAWRLIQTIVARGSAPRPLNLSAPSPQSQAPTKVPVGTQPGGPPQGAVMEGPAAQVRPTANEGCVDGE